MAELLTLPGIERSDRERLSEIRRMKEKIVVGKIVDMKTFKGLKDIEGLLKQKIKLAESPKSGGSERPKEPA